MEPSALMMFLLVFLLLAAGVFWLVGRTSGEDVSQFARPREQRFTADTESIGTYAAVVAAVGEMTATFAEKKPAERLKALRAFLDDAGGGKDFEERFIPVFEPDIEGEWVLPAKGDGARKILFIHGGAFTMGSPLSHRALSAGLARRCDAAVFSLTYSLAPEHARKTMIEECRAAYRWLARTPGPGGKLGDSLVIAGDSAGGTLALVTGRWASREAGVPRPAAVVALSPGTDATLASATRANIETDAVFGPELKPVLSMPPFLWRLIALLKFGIWTQDPEVSPVFGDLANLPPTLIQVSRSELMYGDALAYGGKAQAQGSPVAVQSWNDLPHEWLLFDVETKVATQSWTEIENFVKKVTTEA